MTLGQGLRIASPQSSASKHFPNPRAGHVLWGRVPVPLPTVVAGWYPIAGFPNLPAIYGHWVPIWAHPSGREEGHPSPCAAGRSPQTSAPCIRVVVTCHEDPSSPTADTARAVMGTGLYTWVLPTRVPSGAVEAGVARGNGRTSRWCPHQPQRRQHCRAALPGRAFRGCGLLNNSACFPRQDALIGLMDLLPPKPTPGGRACSPAASGAPQRHSLTSSCEQTLRASRP